MAGMNRVWPVVEQFLLSLLLTLLFWPWLLLLLCVVCR